MTHTWTSPIARLPRRLLSTPSFAVRHLHTNHPMNRPRNRQQRPPREQNRGGRRGQTSSRIGSVPTVQQVTPGASVSIVLKEDQSTGREVQGTVQDLLTRGDHPRGIKVRLTDGRVGRVQRMGVASGSTTISSSLCSAQQFSSQPADNSNHSDGPPPRSLADYLPALGREPSPPPQAGKTTFTTATATCPICGVFEGDEVAVSHHVNEHLS